MSDDALLGKIDISPRAIASIAGNAVVSCYGVVGMAAATLQDGIAEILQFDSYHRGVEAKVVNGKIIIDLYVVVAYNTRISEVAHNVRDSVRFGVERALGMPVAEVNVHVQGLRVSDGV